jgi:predicted transcriptional regulator
MFKEELLRQALKEHNLTITDLAAGLDISTVTLYRKMSGESDFYRAEITKVKQLLPNANVYRIFFGE